MCAECFLKPAAANPFSIEFVVSLHVHLHLENPRSAAIREEKEQLLEIFLKFTRRTVKMSRFLSTLCGTVWCTKNTEEINCKFAI